MLTAAESAYVDDQMKPSYERKYILDEEGNGEYCISVKYLIDNGFVDPRSLDLEGSVLLSITNNGLPTYKLWLRSGNLYINGATFRDLGYDSVTDTLIPSFKLNTCDTTGKR